MIGELFLFYDTDDKPKTVNGWLHFGLYPMSCRWNATDTRIRDRPVYPDSFSEWQGRPPHVLRNRRICPAQANTSRKVKFLVSGIPPCELIHNTVAPHIDLEISGTLKTISWSWKYTLGRGTFYDNHGHGLDTPRHDVSFAPSSHCLGIPPPRTLRNLARNFIRFVVVRSQFVTHENPIVEISLSHEFGRPDLPPLQLGCVDFSRSILVAQLPLHPIRKG